MRRIFSIFMVILILLVNGALAEPMGEDTLITIAENPIPDRDPIDLSVRLRGVDESTLDYAPRRTYQVGDIETFNTGGMDDSEVERRMFELVAATDTVY